MARMPPFLRQAARPGHYRDSAPPCGLSLAPRAHDEWPTAHGGYSRMSVTEPIPQSMALPVQTSIVARWYVLMMMVTLYSLSIADRYAISTVMEPIRLELHLTDSGIAFLTSAVIAFFYVVFGFPLSWLIDRVSRRVVIAFSVLGWSAMTLSTGLSSNYSQLL